MSAALEDDSSHSKTVIGNGRLEATGQEKTSEFVLRQIHLGELFDEGQYRIDRVIGRGGMGIVYEAQELALNRQVALKILPNSGEKNSVQVRRFQNEARVAAQLNHPNIVPVYSVGEESGVRYFAMRLVTGRNLQQAISSLRRDLDKNAVLTSGARKATTQKDTHRKNLDSQSTNRIDLRSEDYRVTSGSYSSNSHGVKTAAKIGVIVAEALHHAHEIGIIHRDIKPANLMLDEHGKVWVTDFGLAQFRDAPSLTRTGVALGTLRYMSPEQATGNRALVDHRTDIYSLGVTIFELLSLRHLIKSGDTATVLRELALGAPVSLRRAGVRIPDDFATILEKALSRSPGERYDTAKEFADDLNRFLNNEPIKASRPNLLKRGFRWGQRHRTMAMGIAVGLVSIFAATVVALGAVIHSLNVEQQARQQTVEQLRESEAARLASESAMALKKDPMLALTLAEKSARLRRDSASNDAILQAWDACHEYKTVPLDFRPAHITWSPTDEKIVVAAHSTAHEKRSQPALIIDGVTGKTTGVLKADRGITSAIFSPNGKFVLTVAAAQTARRVKQFDNPNEIILWRVSDGRRVKTVSRTNAFTAHAGMFGRNGQFILPAEDSATVYSADLQSEIVFRGHKGAVIYAELSPDASKALTVSEDGTVKIWNCTTGKLIRSVAWSSSRVVFVSASFSIDSKSFLLGDNNGVQLWEVDRPESDPQSIQSEFNFRTSRNHHSTIVFGLHDAPKICNPDLSVRAVVETQTVPPESTQQIVDTAFHPGRPILAVTRDHYTELFRSDTGEWLGKLDASGHTNFAVAIHANDRVATIGTDNTLRFWHLRNGIARRTYSTDEVIPSISNLVSQVAQSTDGKKLAVAGHLVRRTSIRKTDGSEIAEFSGIRAGERDTKRVVIVNGRTISVIQSSNSRVVYRGRFPCELTFNCELFANEYLVVVATNGRAWLVHLQSDTRHEIRGQDAEKVFTARSAESGKVVFLTTSTGRFFELSADSPLNQKPQQQFQVPIVTFECSDDGQLFAGIDYAGKLWTWTRNNPPELRALPNEISRVKLSFDGALLLAWNHRSCRTLTCLKTVGGDIVGEIPKSEFVGASWHPARNLVGIAAEDGAVVWDPETGTTRSVTEQPAAAIAMTSNDVGVVLGPGNDRRRNNLPSHLMISPLQDNDAGTKNRQQPLGFTGTSIRANQASGQFIVSGKGHAASTFDFATGEHLFETSLHHSPLKAIFFTDARNVTTISEDGTIQQSSEAGLTRAGKLKLSRIQCTAISPDGNSLVLCEGSKIFTLATNAENAQPRLLGTQNAPIENVRFSSVPHLALTMGNNTIALWDLRTGEKREHEFTNLVTADFSPSGELIFGLTRTEGSYSINHGELRTHSKSVATFPGVRFARFFDNDSLALLFEDRFEMLSLKDLSVKETWPVPGTARRFAFSPDGQTVLLDSASSALSLQERSTGRVAFHLYDAEQRYYSSNPFTLDGKWLLIANQHKIVKWPVDPTTIVNGKTRELTKKEHRRFRTHLTRSVLEQTPSRTSKDGE